MREYKTALVISRESRRFEGDERELQELELVESGSAVVDQGPEAVRGEAVFGVLQVVGGGAAKCGESLGLGELEHSLNKVRDFLLVPANDVEQGDERVLGAVALSVPAVAELRLLATLRKRIRLCSRILRFGPLRDEHVLAPILQCPQIASNTIMGVDFSFGGVSVAMVERSDPELPQEVVRGDRFRFSEDVVREVRGRANGDGRRADGAFDDRCPAVCTTKGGMLRRAVQHAFLDVDSHFLFLCPACRRAS